MLGLFATMVDLFIWPLVLWRRIIERAAWSTGDIILLAGFTLVVTQRYWSSFQAIEWLLD
jgi:hypothetical protein